MTDNNNTNDNNISTILIKKRIQLEHIYMTKNMIEHLTNKVMNMINVCSQEHGHILNVKKIISYENTEDTIFSVTFEAEVLKPEIGKKLKGTVCMVSSQCILIDIKNVQKVLVNSTNLQEKGYKYNEQDNIYEIIGKKDSEKNKKISVTTEIDIIVTAVKYSNKNFVCIGDILMEKTQESKTQKISTKTQRKK